MRSLPITLKTVDVSLVLRMAERAARPASRRNYLLLSRSADGWLYLASPLLVAIVRQMIQHYQQLSRQRTLTLQRWRPHCHLDGRRVVLEAGQQRTRGTCRGIDADGALVIDSDTGRQTFYAGSVTTE